MVDAGTSKVTSAFNALADAAAASKVTAFLAYAGDPPVDSFAPVVLGSPVCNDAYATVNESNIVFFAAATKAPIIYSPLINVIVGSLKFIVIVAFLKLNVIVGFLKVNVAITAPAA